jgi:hypothetical protein
MPMEVEVFSRDNAARRGADDELPLAHRWRFVSLRHPEFFAADVRFEFSGDGKTIIRYMSNSTLPGVLRKTHDE